MKPSSGLFCLQDPVLLPRKLALPGSLLEMLLSNPPSSRWLKIWALTSSPGEVVDMLKFGKLLTVLDHWRLCLPSLMLKLCLGWMSEPVYPVGLTEGPPGCHQPHGSIGFFKNLLMWHCWNLMHHLPSIQGLCIFLNPLARKRPQKQILGAGPEVEPQKNESLVNLHEMSLLPRIQKWESCFPLCLLFSSFISLLVLALNFPSVWGFTIVFSLHLFEIENNNKHPSSKICRKKKEEEGKERKEWEM